MIYTTQNPKRVKGLGNFEESKTQQSMANEVNINKIIQRYNTTGMLVHPSEMGRGGRPMFGDFSHIDFRETQTIIAQANSMFMELPPQVRSRFKNDPANLIDFINNPDNRAEAEKLGLVNPIKIEEPAQQMAAPEPPVAA